MNDYKDLRVYGPGEPDFVNDFNALRGVFKPRKLNDFKGLAVSIANLRSVLNVTAWARVRPSASGNATVSSTKSRQIVADVQNN